MEEKRNSENAVIMELDADRPRGAVPRPPISFIVAALLEVSGVHAGSRIIGSRTGGSTWECVGDGIGSVEVIL